MDSRRIPQDRGHPADGADGAVVLIPFMDALRIENGMAKRAIAVLRMENFGLVVLEVRPHPLGLVELFLRWDAPRPLHLFHPHKNIV